MKKFSLGLMAMVLLLLSVVSCQKDQLKQDNIPLEVITKLQKLGFNPDGIEVIAEGYRIERDIIITPEFLAGTPEVHTVPNAEQYSTNNLVSANGGRNITIYIPSGGSGGGGKKGGGGSSGFSSTYVAALDEAISRYNAESLTITFSRVTSSNADIVFSRLSKGDERRGILGSSGFPSNGDPYGSVLMSGILESTYGLSVNGIATIMAHEIGHCIGFRHTDYYDRSISCGGGTSNEGAGSIGANLIPGTPSTADLAGNGSWMLSCTDGSNRPFTHYDQVALDYLY